jgi:hypothetical protein
MESIIRKLYRASRDSGKLGAVGYDKVKSS